VPKLFVPLEEELDDCEWSATVRRVLIIVLREMLPNIREGFLVLG
jgi:hypothetical protein